MEGDLHKPSVYSVKEKESDISIKASQEVISPESSQELSVNQLGNDQTSSQNNIETLANLADSTLLPRGKEEQKKRFDNLCRRLAVHNEIATIAWSLLLKIPEEDNTIEHEAYWNACALYAAGTVGESANVNVIPLSQLLRENQIRMVDFFDPLKSFIALLKLGPQAEENLKLLEKKFVVSTILFQKYEKVFSELLQPPSDVDRSPTNNKERRSDSFLVFSFGWTLFLVAKGKLLSNPPDLVNAFHLLLCCINFLFVHAPPHLRKMSLKEPPFANKTEDGEGTVDTLKSICDLNSANYSEVLNVQASLFTPYIQMLSKNPHNILKYNPAKLPTEATLAKTFYLGGLLEGSNLQKNKSAINRDYEFMYLKSGDFDERLFVDQQEQIGTPSKVTSQTANYYHLRRGYGQDHFGFASPYKNVPPSTHKSPMSTTMATVQWLKQQLSSKPKGPSERLLKYFKSCDKDVTQSIEERLNRLTATILPPDAEGETWDEKIRIDLGVKLYYRILESMLRAEEVRLGQTNFTSLLNHDNFHRSLLACCVEIVLFSYKMTRMAFPYILDRFDLRPFEFCKIVESVVRHEADLPRVIVRHLSNIEERILESLAWEEGSPLLILLKDKSNIQTLTSYLQQTSASTKKTSLLVLASPLLKSSKPGRPPFSPAPLDSNNTSTPQPKKGGSNSLELFYRKIFHLASVRSKDLCMRLQITPKIYSQVWQALVEVLTSQYILMINRHLDQLIMCTIYGVCRVNQLGITFRAIIEQYRLQQQAASKIFRDVVLNSLSEKGDIITFYNSIFIPVMESYLLQFQQNAEKENSTTTNESSEQIQGQQSPTKVSSKHNVYLSPIKLRATPAPKFFFSFGESPARGLHQINESLNSSKPRGKSKLQRQLFGDQVEDSPKRKSEEIAETDENQQNKAQKLNFVNH